MQFRTLAAAAAAVLLSTLSTTVVADEGKGDLPVGYPFKCADFCGPIVTVSQSQCLGHPESCFCYQPKMKHLIPLCEACSYNARDIGNGIKFYPAIKKLNNVCGFKTTSVTQGVAAATAVPIMAGGAMAAMAIAAGAM